MPLLTVAQVAELLGVSRSHVRNLAHGGTLGFYRVGLRIQFDTEEVARYLAAARNAAPPRHRTST